MVVGFGCGSDDQAVHDSTPDRYVISRVFERDFSSHVKLWVGEDIERTNAAANVWCKEQKDLNKANEDVQRAVKRAQKASNGKGVCIVHVPVALAYCNVKINAKTKASGWTKVDKTIPPIVVDHEERHVLCVDSCCCTKARKRMHVTYAGYVCVPLTWREFAGAQKATWEKMTEIMMGLVSLRMEGDERDVRSKGWVAAAQREVVRAIKGSRAMADMFDQTLGMMESHADTIGWVFSPPGVCVNIIQLDLPRDIFDQIMNFYKNSPEWSDPYRGLHTSLD